MQLKRSLRNGLIYTLIISICLTALPRPAQASTLDTLIDMLRKIEAITPPGTLPCTADELEDSKDLLQDMINAGDNLSAQTNIINEYLQANDSLPPWLDTVLDYYILFAAHDYYGLAGKLVNDPDTLCAVLSILIPGSGAFCALFDELIELAEGLWDVGTAIGEFFADLGGAVWDGLKSAGCSLGLGGCDDGPDTPPEVFVYEYIFHPRLAEGLTARKSTDSGAFDSLVGQLKAEAAAFGKNYHPEGPFDIKGLYAACCNDPGAVNRAAIMYASTVNTEWTADIANHVLPLRAEKFKQYSNNPATINNLAQTALQKFSPEYAWNPQDTVVNSCVQTFKFVDGYGFAHIDTWLNMVNQLGDEAKALQPAVQSNQDLCNTLWQLKKKDIGQIVYTYTQENYCGQFGSALQCQSIPDYRGCLKLLSPFDNADRCRANTLTAGKEAADQVMQQITAEGTAHPEKWQKANPQSSGPGLALHSEKPYRLIGYRPTHTYFCDKFYSEKFGDLPQKLLQCSYQTDQNYVELVDDVKNAVEQLNKEYGGTFASGKYWDPLLVEASTGSSVNELQQENRSFGFESPSAKPGFNYSNFKPKIGIDGVDTPVIFFDIQGAVAAHMNDINTPVRDIRDMIDPRLGVEKLDIQDRVSKVAMKSGLQVKAEMQKPGMVSGVGNLAGPQAAGTGQHVMSGTLPAGQQPSHLPTISSTGQKLEVAQKGAISLMQQGSPDLQVDQMVVINTRKIRWNGTLALDAKTLRPAGNGRFQVPIVLTVKNAGNAASSPCRIAWPSAAEILPLPALKPGQVHNLKATIELAPGTHRLQLQLDKLKQVKESNERNNSAAVTLRITGSDNGSSRGVSPSLPPGSRISPSRTPDMRSTLTPLSNSR